MPTPSIQLTRRAVVQHSGGFVLRVIATPVDGFRTAKVFVWFLTPDAAHAERVAQPQDLRELGEVALADATLPYYRHDEFMVFCSSLELVHETWLLLLEDVNALVADENNLPLLATDTTVLVDGSELLSPTPALPGAGYTTLFGRRVGDYVLIQIDGTTVYLPAVESTAS